MSGQSEVYTQFDRTIAYLRAQAPDYALKDAPNLPIFKCRYSMWAFYGLFDDFLCVLAVIGPDKSIDFANEKPSISWSQLAVRSKSRSSEYLEAVSEFITFLSGKKLTHDEILSHMVMVVLAPMNAEAITLDHLNDRNQVENIGRWGMPVEMIKDYVDVYSFNDKYPSTDTLRYRRTTWINTLPDFGDDYPLLKDFPYTTGAKSFITFPIEKAGTPVAALGVYSRDNIFPNAGIESFLTAVGSVLSMYMFSQDSKAHELLKGQGMHIPSYAESAEGELTERQQVILRLIGEDRTNLAISELLGYSESTIRQETIKIFAKLNCTGRKEAVQIYREQLVKSKELKL